MNEIIQGLQCSPFEANAILDTVYKVYAPYFDTSGSLKPGQILFQVVTIENGASIHLENCKQITVTLTLNGEEEDLKIREKEGVIGLRQYRIQRVCEEAFQLRRSPFGTRRITYYGGPGQPLIQLWREDYFKRFKSAKREEYCLTAALYDQRYGTIHIPPLPYRQGVAIR
ncbi:DUF1670 domain-containing protein [Candidatus Dependentiae bacterium]|nr:DUF1670 domain-containing protein [Candidatus Dependentiae bacterium]